MRILAVDPGSKRVGLALSDPTGTIAQALATVPAEPKAGLPARIADIARAREAERIVVGLPRRLDGTFGPEARSAEKLAAELRRSAGLPVDLVDERMTTAAAERAMIEGGVRRAEARWPAANRGHHIQKSMSAEDQEPAQHVTLIDEAGRERQFQLHDAFDHEGAVYYLVENVDDPNQVLLLREAAGGLETVEGDEFQRVIAALEEDEVE